VATVREAIRRLTIVATKQGVDEATASLNKLAAAQQNVAVVSQSTERATLSQERRFEALERRYVDTVRAQQEYDKVQRMVNAAVAQNPALQERANVVLASARERYVMVTKAANDNTAAHARMQGGIRGILEAVTKGGGAESMFKGIATAITSMLGPLGSVAVAIGVVDLAAIALFATFSKQGPTAAKVLEEQARLLGVIKSAYDAVTDSASKWYEQSRDVTRLQLLQQEIDLQQKLTEAVIKGLRATVEIPIGGSIPRIKDDYKAFSDAIFTLNEGWQQGTPNVRAFVDEVARIALLNPTLQKLGAELINSVGDASKFAQALQQVKDAMQLITSGGQGLSGDARGRLGLSEAQRAQANGYDLLIQKTKDRIEELQLEAQVAGQASDAVLKLRLQHEAERAAKKAGVEVNQQVLDQLKEELALADRSARIAGVRASIEFDRRTIGLSNEDLQIAQQLRQLYGNDIPAALASTEAAAMRVNDALRQFDSIGREAFRGFFADFKGALDGGATGWKAFEQAGMNALNRIADRLISIAAEQLWAQAFGGITRGLGGGLGGLFGGSSAAAGATGTGFSLTTLSGLYHTGGTAGVATAQRYVHPAHFDAAPRYHGGIDYAGGEVPAVLMRGEEVGWPGDLARKYGGNNVRVTVNNYGNDNVEVRQRDDGNGDVDIELLVGNAAAKQAARPGSALSNTLDQRNRLARR
jgi:hypothetical protein